MSSLRHQLRCRRRRPRPPPPPPAPQPPLRDEEPYGDLLRIPLELRNRIYSYVLDINSRVVDYIKGPGSEDFKDPEYSKCQNKPAIFRSGVPSQIRELPRRTNILLVNKSIKAEALSVMYSENRFIITPGRSEFHLFPLKEDLAFCECNRKEGYLCSYSCNKRACVLTECYEGRGIPVLNVSHELLTRIRFLVVNLWTCSEKAWNFLVIGLPFEDPGPYLRQIPGMINFVEGLQHIHCLRVHLRCRVHYGPIRTLMLKTLMELSRLRYIKKIEARVEISWYFPWWDGVFESEPSLPRCEVPGKTYYLAGEYHDHLEKETRKFRESEVVPCTVHFDLNKVLTLNGHLWRAEDAMGDNDSDNQEGETGANETVQQEAREENADSEQVVEAVDENVQGPVEEVILESSAKSDGVYIPKDDISKDSPPGLIEEDKNVVFKNVVFIDIDNFERALAAGHILWWYKR